MRVLPVALVLILACGDGSVDPDAGADGAVDSGLSCEPPAQDCGGRCVDVERDPAHCGGCGQPCAVGAFCQDRACVTSCGALLEGCGGACVDVLTDRAHCGGCDRPCADDRQCQNGRCVCPERTADCGGSCVETDNDRLNCGLCDRECGPLEVCSNGSCERMREAECNNGADDDQDGEVDCADSDCLDATRPCGGGAACGDGVETCLSTGSWSDCEGGTGAEEICGDGIDQDCDGSDVRNEDEWEPNDSCSQCALIAMAPDPDGLVVTGRFDSVNDPVDCYRFVGADGGLNFAESIEVSLTGIPPDHDYDIYLYQGQEACEAEDDIARSVASGNADEMLSWSERLGQNDDALYFIRVERFRGQSCDDDYSLTVTGLR